MGASSICIFKQNVLVDTLLSSSILNLFFFGLVLYLPDIARREPETLRAGTGGRTRSHDPYQ